MVQNGTELKPQVAESSLRQTATRLLTARQIMLEARRLGATTPSESADMIRADRDAR